MTKATPPVTAQHSACPATNRRGSPCKSSPLPGGKHCFYHAPDMAAARTEGRRLGGKNAGKLRAIKGRRAQLTTIGELTRFVANTVHDVVEVRIPYDVGRTALYGCGILRQLIESSTLEQRIAALEARLGNQPNGGTRKWSG